MEAFSLLKFWRNSGSDVCSDTIISCSAGDVNKVDVRNRAPEAVEDTDDDDDSFFDLVFTAPNCGGKEGKNAECTLVNGPSNAKRSIQCEEPPCKTKVFPIDSNSKPQSPVSLLKSAPKFRVFLLGFKKSKSEKMQAGEGLTATPTYQFQKSSENEQSKRFTVKCKVREAPAAASSLFSRDNSLRSKLQRERSFVDFPVDDSSKALQKDIPKYLKLIKPLYARASKRYTEQSRLSSDRISSGTPLSSPATAPPSSPRKLSEEKRVNRAAGFRVVSKHLGKSRSASSTVGVIPSPANRRDDTLLLQHDGIQSAILYCKRSYNLSNDCSTTLLRLSSEPCEGKSVNQSSNLSQEQTRCCSI